MIRTGAIIIIAIVLCVATAAEAHVPDRCRRLFIQAGKETQEVVRKNEKVRSIVNRLRPERARRYDWFDEFERLTNATSNLLRAMTYQHQALTKAINCVAKR